MIDEAKSFWEETQNILNKSQKKAGINSEKVQQAVSGYLQIARDTQLNYNELLQVIAITRDLVLQSLNKVPISALPDITSDAAKV